MKLIYKIQNEPNELTIYVGMKRALIYFKPNKCYIVNKNANPAGINSANLFRFVESINLRKYFRFVNYTRTTDIWKHLC